MNTRFNRVLILSASAGAGHTRAAEALASAFKLAGAAGEIQHVDTLKHTNRVFKHLYTDAYYRLVKSFPSLLGWLYKQSDRPWKNQKRRLMFDKLNTRPMVRMIREFKPDLIVATHFLPAEIGAYLKRKGKLDCPIGVVVTDFDAHAMWLTKPIDHYFVALDETKAHLEALSIGTSVHVTGIPIDPVFSESPSRGEAAAQVEIDPSRPAILMSAGSFGRKKIPYLIKAVAQLQTPAQVVIISGRNVKLHKAVLETVVSIGDTNVTFKPIGFTEKMHVYMSAADVMLGKPGGLTMSESLAKGLGFVVVNPIPGQEERNADHLLERGCAIKINNLPALAFKVDGLLGDPQRLATMQSNARALAKPQAATEIVRILTSSLSASGPG